MNSSSLLTVQEEIQWTSLHCSKNALTDFFGWFLQGVLASLAFTCLIAKRFCEPPYIRRSWETWWYDTSKQGIGALVIHMTNVYVAPLFQGDPCTWYIINFLLDSTIGLFIIYVGIRICQFLAKRNKWDAINFGEYNAPKSWVYQTWIYIGLMAIVKLITTLFVQLDVWDNVKNFVLSPFSNPKIELAVVMLIIPFFVNILIFWVTDNFLMRHNRKKRLGSSREQSILQKVKG
ncbi:store-operated calcium entry regulator STIMATE-like isoform X2 [Hermetia illucens]|uniref:store-operated calcium entry regulator STIMATE-like isoform X2 n=1 Tax=Hermetia illucens TaxID=343691 RepID=UPI0018CC2559|nr:store-operated calcium entry regulator STIMATE-like isoform X2 [Hermetia illucens]